MKPEPKLIEIALKCLADSETNQGIVKQNKIPTKYKGYVASFGGTVVQIGIMPACMAFCVDDNKKKVAALMFAIYCDRYNIDDNEGLDVYLKGNWNSGWNKAFQKTFRDRMTRVAVSLKLALRTYEFDDSDPLD